MADGDSHTLTDRLLSRARGLPGRHGGPWTLAGVVAVVLLALALRVDFAIDDATDPLPDSVTYEHLAANLYENGSFTAPDVAHPNDYSPGTPLLFVGIYAVTGGVHPLIGRLAVALLGALSVLLAYLIGRRLAGPRAALAGALPVAIYPALLEFNGMVMSEPLAACSLAGAMLALLRAAERSQDGLRAWIVPGVLLGITALIRPEYLAIGIALGGIVALAPGWPSGARAAGARGGVVLAAMAVIILPWAIRNLVVLDRFVPISTGGGKALAIGTYLPGFHGDVHDYNAHIRTDLARRYPGLRVAMERRFHNLPSASTGELLETLAVRRYPDSSGDGALGRLGWHQLWHYAGSEPGELVSAFARKAWFAWSRGQYSAHHASMRRPGWLWFHRMFVLLALIGLGLLAWQRRWEALAFGVLIGAAVLLTAVTLPSERRVLVLVPVLGALVAVALARGRRPTALDA